MRFPITLTMTGIFFLIAGSYFLSLGIRALRSKRPFLVPARQQMWFFLCCFAPQYINMFFVMGTLFNSSFQLTSVILNVVNLALSVFFIAVFLRQFKGYIAYGIAATSFREALIASFQKLNIKFEEQFSIIRFPDINKELQIIEAEWLGSAQMRFKGKSDNKFLADIAREVSVYYNNNPCDTKGYAFMINVTIGSVLLIISLGSFWWAYTSYLRYL